MTLPVYGNPLTLTQIATEYSAPNTNIALENFYAGGTYVTAGTLGYPTGGSSVAIPSSGPISIANFYGSTAFTAPNFVGNVSVGFTTTGSYITDNAYGNGIFAYTQANTIWYTSNGGSSWSSATLTFTPGSLCYGNGYWLATAVQTSSNILSYSYSTNLTSWSTFTNMFYGYGYSTNNTYTGQCSCYVPSLGYMAVGVLISSNKGAYSFLSSTINGWTSSPQTISTTLYPIGLATNGTNIVLLLGNTNSYSPQGALYTSIYSGGSWSTPTALPGYSGTTVGTAKITYGLGMYMVCYVQGSGAAYTTYTSTSTDGVTFSSATSISTVASSVFYMTSFGYANGAFYAVASNPSSSATTYYIYSTNGTSWRTPLSMPTNSTTSYQDIGCSMVLGGPVSGTATTMVFNCKTNGYSLMEICHSP